MKWANSLQSDRFFRVRLVVLCAQFLNVVRV